jgi:hypothetical protein
VDFRGSTIEEEEKTLKSKYVGIVEVANCPVSDLAQGKTSSESKLYNDEGQKGDTYIPECFQVLEGLVMSFKSSSLLAFPDLTWPCLETHFVW